MQVSVPWRGIIQGSLRRSALEVITAVIDRLSDPEHTEQIARQASEQSGLPIKRQWMPSGVSFGHAGSAIFFGHLDRCFPDQGWDRVAHNHLAQGTQFLETLPASMVAPGLFGGLAGTCFATLYLSKNGTRYQRLLTTLETLLCHKAAAIPRVPSSFPVGVHFGDYDLIAGPAGVGAYLLLRHDVPEVAAALDAVLERILFLSEWEGDRSRFFIPAELQATDRHREEYPNGAVDCGLAHGVPGPLAFLALAQCQGIERPDLVSALRRLTEWILAERCADAWGITWPYAVPPRTAHAVSIPSSRAAWCYGSPGVARALWLAGCALHDADIQQIALAAMEGVRARPLDARNIPSPILCHGVAGLLQIVLRFANDTQESSFVEMAHALTQELVDLFEPDSLAGFRDLEHDGRKIDNPGILEGAAGIGLTLLAAVTDVSPAWDRLFLLS